MSTSATVFYTEAKGSYFFVFDPNTSTQNLGNLDKVEYMGFEAELQAQVTDGLEVYLRGGYTDSEIKEEHRTDGTGLPSDVGNQAPLVSEYTINVGALWRVPLGGSDWDFFIRPDYQIIGPTWFYPDNFTERDTVDLLNLRAGIETDSWSLVAWSRNLTDEEYNAEWSPGAAVLPEPRVHQQFRVQGAAAGLGHRPHIPLLGCGDGGSRDGDIGKLPTRLHHTAYVSRDLEATRKFYEEVIGLPLLATWCEKDMLFGAERTYCHLFFGLADGGALAFLPVRRILRTRSSSGRRCRSRPFTTSRCTSTRRRRTASSGG